MPTTLRLGPAATAIAGAIHCSLSKEIHIKVSTEFPLRWLSESYNVAIVVARKRSMSLVEATALLLFRSLFTDMLGNRPNVRSIDVDTFTLGSNPMVLR